MLDISDTQRETLCKCLTEKLPLGDSDKVVDVKIPVGYFRAIPIVIEKKNGDRYPSVYCLRS